MGHCPQAVERALAELQARFAAAAGGPEVGVVRLSGLVHTDERTAFQEIARQLCAAFGCSFSRTVGIEQNMSFLGNMLRILHRCASHRRPWDYVFRQRYYVI